jgi:hypothetical protein
MDLLYIAVTAAFAGLTLLFIYLCDQAGSAR